MPLGSIVNALAIIIGGLVGLFLHQRFSARFQTIVFQALGLAALLIGIQMGLKVENFLTCIFSLAVGGLIGEALRLEDRLEQLGKMIKSKIKSSHERFVEGFAITSILYGVGAMAIVGSIQEGINGDPSVLYAKALLDGFTAIAFGAAYGLGVVFSSIPILLYQGGITLLAAQFKMTASPLLMNQISAVGGVLVMGIGLTILDIKKIRLANLLPSLLIITLLTLYLK